MLSILEWRGSFLALYGWCLGAGDLGLLEETCLDEEVLDVLLLAGLGVLTLLLLLLAGLDGDDRLLVFLVVPDVLDLLLEMFLDLLDCCQALGVLVVLPGSVG